jgi:ribosomal protein S4E
MPTYKYTKIQNKCAEEKEQFFINLYVGRNAKKEHIPYCEQRATLEPGAGQKILAKKSVQEQIKTKLEPVRLAQMHQAAFRQAAITEAVAKAKAAQQRWLIREKGANADGRKSLSQNRSAHVGR